MKSIFQGAFAACLMIALMLCACLELARGQVGSIQVTPTPPPTLTVVAPTTWTATHLTGSVTAVEWWDSNDLRLGSGEIPYVQIVGLGDAATRKPNGPLYATVMGWHCPTKPDTVKVTLTTKDGRQWHAVWVEGKP